MDSIEAWVSFSSLSTNLVNLPSELASLLYSANINVQSVVIELSWKSSRLNHYGYCGWSGMVSRDTTKPVLEIEPLFANSIGLKENAKVTVNLKFNSPEAHKIHLEPITSSDWELVELHAQLLEDRLLNQTRAVSLNQELLVYPTSTVTAKLRVVKIEPSPNKTNYCKISSNCEVIVAPKVRKAVTTTSGSAKSKSIKRSVDLKILASVCLPHDGFEAQDSLQFQVLTSEVSSKYARVSLLGTDKHVVVRVVSGGLKGYIGLTSAVAQTLDVNNCTGELMIVESADRPLIEIPHNLIIHSFVTQSPDKRVLRSRQQDLKNAEKLKVIREHLDALGFFVDNAITNRVNLPIIPEVLPYGGQVEFKLADGWFVSTACNYTFTLGDDIVKDSDVLKRVVDNEIEQFHSTGGKLIGYDSLVLDITRQLLKNVNGILIHGPSGSGKSQLIDTLVSQLYYLTTFKLMQIDLEEYLNEVGNFEALKKTFTQLFLKLIKHKKVILVVENIHLVCFKEQEQHDNTVTNSFTEFFIINYLKLVGNSYDIKIIYTCNSKDGLNKLLVGNSVVISQTYKLSAPNKTQRNELFEYFLGDYNLKFNDENFNDLLNDTEGYLPTDLKALVERAYHEVVFSHQNDPSEIKTIAPIHFEKALEGFTSSGLRSIKLQQSEVKWQDIGGLKKAKEILLETLEWPTKYAAIFANCPLRLRSGILLYGYPGCGKTLLASAVSSQCGLNFISIKGPEILNKYIGASEQSVRELFERAQAAKPCVLFFDEFDSIAPKRGHDSTGVTDRVVNQMLTQMDGAEGLDGVYVLAATSRPDLIDSALLRPGRLDKSVICDLPDYDNRYDIIVTVANKMKLAEDIDLAEIARATDGYSGADLQALGYNAYLNAVHRRLKHDKEQENKLPEPQDAEKVEFFQLDKELSLAEKSSLHEKIDNILNKNNPQEVKNSKVDYQVAISLEDFQQALKDTSPSISVSERTKLKKIYNEFVSDRDGNMPNGTPSNQIGGRTTLM